MLLADFRNRAMLLDDTTEGKVPPLELMGFVNQRLFLLRTTLLKQPAGKENYPQQDVNSVIYRTQMEQPE